MGVKVGLSQPIVPHSSSSHTLSSVISLFEQRTKSSSSSNRRSFGNNNNALVWRDLQGSNQSSLFGKRPSTRLLRSHSYENPKSGDRPLIRACSASLGNSDEEYNQEFEELATKFNLSEDKNSIDAEESESIEEKLRDKGRETSENSIRSHTDLHFAQNPRSFPPFMLDSAPPWLGIRPEPPNWPEHPKIIPASVERKANSFELPLSLRIIKRKQWYERAFNLQENFRDNLMDAGESAYCSVKKAFSSMVFMIRELQSYSLQMRQLFFYEDLQGILVSVQKELHASFVWLFQQVFSTTPTFMVYVMIFLANFTVYSMGNNTAIAAAVPPPGSYTSDVSVMETREENPSPRFELKTFSVSSPVAGNFDGSGRGGGGNGKLPSAAGAADRDGQLDRSFEQHRRTILPDEASPVSSIGSPTIEAGEEAALAWEEEEKQGISVSSLSEEVKLWNSIVDEASRMQTCLRDESLDHETLQRFVSPITVEMESEDYYESYFRTELLYQQAIAQDPENPLLLSNFAQFLFLVVHDHDRAENYFKRAISTDPPDAESLSRYASFLWVARKDLAAAEETFLEAIAADPGNTFYAGNYAHFLWSTGGEDTCYPLNEA